MRPLTMTALSLLASIGLAFTTRAFAEHIEFSQAISQVAFTRLLICALCALATLACLWIALSYLLLAYAQNTTKTHDTFIKRAARLAIPSVRRALAGALVLSLVTVQPAYADDSGDTPTGTSIADISWGSPDLLDIAAQNDEYAEPPISSSPTQDPSDAQPSPSPTNPLTSPIDSTTITNPLTSTPTTTPPEDKAPNTTTPPQRALSPPTLSLPQISAAPTPTYTVKSGDTLWDIAARHLPSAATDSDIARACLSWDAANPTLENPNLIFPGQTLTIPQETH